MIKPLRDYVVLEKVPEEKEVGGIIIATKHDNDSAVAKVIAVGPGYVNEDGHKVEVQSKIGDKVIYGKYGGQTVTVDGEDYLILRGDDLYAVVTK